MKRSEGFFEGYQDSRLFFQAWEPQGTSRGLMVITHGHGEHSECYHRLIDALSDLQWTFLAWDLRGHGQSEGHRGYALSFQDYVRDFEMFWNQVVPNYSSSEPPVFFGHSMGALIQLKALAGILEGVQQPQILSNPFLGLHLQVPPYKEAAAVLLQHVLPQITLSNEIHDEDLSRDVAVLQEYSEDTLRHRKISSGVFLGAQESQKSVLSRPEVWKGPIQMLLSENDPVVSTPVNLQFYDRLICPKECTVFENRKHELINDLGREEVFAKIRECLVTS